jgi:hypothetical protein
MNEEFETTIKQIKEILLAEENKTREVIWIK